MTATATSILDLYQTATPEVRASVANAIMTEWAESHPKNIVPAFWAMFGAPTGEQPPDMTPELAAEIKDRIAHADDSVSMKEMWTIIDKAESANAPSGSNGSR